MKANTVEISRNTKYLVVSLMINRYIFCLCLHALFCIFYPGSATAQVENYKALQHRLIKGWHTYNSNSVLSHVYMPGAFSLKLSLKSNHVGLYGYMGDAYISSNISREETVNPIAYSKDGRYTDLILRWDNNIVQVQSATDGKEIVLLITPVKLTQVEPSLIVESGILWNNSGRILKLKGKIEASLSNRKIIISGTEREDSDFLSLNAPYLSFNLSKPIGVFTGSSKTIEQIKSIINTKKTEYEKTLVRFGNKKMQAMAIMNAIGWNTIYDPLNKRVVTPVSRYWNAAFGGPYVLFDWDTYFGAYMASLYNKDLAFSNAIAITKSLTPGGFVPNYTAGPGKASYDRSQPPVGSMVVREIYRKHPEKWFLEFLFDDLLVWNRWWLKDRRTSENLLCWGSNVLGDPSANTWQAAAYESGLDNSPMYDSVPFNKATHRMELADVGLQSLYIMDCEALADIAMVLGKNKIAKELTDRAGVFKSALSKLWHQPSGQYLNYRTDLKEFNTVTSPTTFYPLIVGVPDTAMAGRMVREHLQNKNEYDDQWILPSCPVNHPAYRQQNYWRGRIWGPLNFLVYLGLRQYQFDGYKKNLVQKSSELLLKNYAETGGFIYENYNAVSGKGRNDGEKLNASDNYYHWGALLGFISLIEDGHMGRPLEKLAK